MYYINEFNIDLHFKNICRLWCFYWIFIKNSLMVSKLINMLHVVHTYVHIMFYGNDGASDFHFKNI